MLIRNTQLALLFVSLRMCHFSIVFESACYAICLWLILGAVWSVLATLSLFGISPCGAVSFSPGVHGPFPDALPVFPLALARSRPSLQPRDAGLSPRMLLLFSYFITE